MKVIKEGKELTKEENLLLELSFKVNNYIDDKFKREFPEKYRQWGGNHCLQTAIMICSIIRNIKNYSCEVFYGIMRDNYAGNRFMYNHAYAIAVNKKTKEKYIIDMSRNDRSALFAHGKGIPDDYESGCSAYGYKGIQVTARIPVDYKKCLVEEKEFYTCKPSIELYNEILNFVSEDVKLLNEGGKFYEGK